MKESEIRNLVKNQKIRDDLGEGRRKTSWGHVATYDFLLRGLYRYYGISTIELIQSSIDNRVEEVKMWLKRIVGYNGVNPWFT
jgi:hypothetical protein